MARASRSAGGDGGGLGDGSDEEGGGGDCGDGGGDREHTPQLSRQRMSTSPASHALHFALFWLAVPTSLWHQPGSSSSHEGGAGLGDGDGSDGDGGGGEGGDASTSAGGDHGCGGGLGDGSDEEGGGGEGDGGGSDREHTPQLSRQRMSTAPASHCLHRSIFCQKVPTSRWHQTGSVSSHGGGDGVASASTLVSRKSNGMRSMVSFMVWSLSVCSPGQRRIRRMLVSQCHSGGAGFYRARCALVRYGGV